jgi:hypothetical protein
MNTFNDVWESHASGVVVHDIGTKFATYTTSVPLQPVPDDDMFQMDADLKLKAVGKKASQLAAQAAKEIVGGVSIVGGMGYNAIHNYLTGEKPYDYRNGDTEIPVDPQDGVVLFYIM